MASHFRLKIANKPFTTQTSSKVFSANTCLSVLKSTNYSAEIDSWMAKTQKIKFLTNFRSHSIPIFTEKNISLSFSDLLEKSQEEDLQIIFDSAMKDFVPIVCNFYGGAKIVNTIEKMDDDQKVFALETLSDKFILNIGTIMSEPGANVLLYLLKKIEKIPSKLLELVVNMKQEIMENRIGRLTSFVLISKMSETQMRIYARKIALQIFMLCSKYSFPVFFKVLIGELDRKTYDILSNEITHVKALFTISEGYKLISIVYNHGYEHQRSQIIHNISKRFSFILDDTYAINFVTKILSTAKDTKKLEMVILQNLTGLLSTTNMNSGISCLEALLKTQSPNSATHSAIFLKVMRNITELISSPKFSELLNFLLDNYEDKRQSVVDIVLQNVTRLDYDGGNKGVFKLLLKWKDALINVENFSMVANNSGEIIDTFEANTIRMEVLSLLFDICPEGLADTFLLALKKHCRLVGRDKMFLQKNYGRMKRETFMKMAEVILSASRIDPRTNHYMRELSLENKELKELMEAKEFYKNKA